MTDAARALGLRDRGTLAPASVRTSRVGRRAGDELAYWFGRNPCRRVVVRRAPCTRDA